MNKRKIKYYILLLVGFFGFTGVFSLLHRYLVFKSAVGGPYGSFIRTFGRPVFGALWVLYFLSIVLLLHQTDKQKWKTKGIYTAFIISLFTEMFGSGLLLYLFSPFFKYPLLINQNFYLKNWLFFRFTGSYIILFGVILIIVGWKKVYTSSGLATSGIYRFIRHPQYIGFILISTGLLIFWPTVIAAILYPSLLVIYVRQAIKEDKYLEKTYGEEFLSYKKKTPFFFPLLPFISRVKV